MESNIRDVQILIYGSILALLFGIAGSLIGDKLGVFVKDNVSLLYVVIIIFMFIFVIFREIVRVFGIGKTKSNHEIPLEDAHNTTSRFYEKHKGEYLFRFKDESSLKEIFVLFLQLSLLLITIITLFLFLGLGFIRHLAALVFFVIFILLCIFYDKLQTKIDFKIFNFAKSNEAKIDFLLKSGEIFSSFKEYHLIFDFKENTFYFVCFDKDDKLEKKIEGELVAYLKFPKPPRAS